jgi:hypothetical protein
LCGAAPAPANTGALAFCEAITVLDKRPREDFGWGDTIIFFCDGGRFRYEALCGGELVNTESGVICIPNNYAYADGGAPKEGWLRVTARADYAGWRALRGNLSGAAAPAYTAAKREWHNILNTTALKHLPPLPSGVFEHSIAARDMFTPPTVERFTGRLNGAIYGAPRKSRDGRTHLRNLFICGTDQGFLGITGAMLSGISMSNLHLLGGGTETTLSTN